MKFIIASCYLLVFPLGVLLLFPPMTPIGVAILMIGVWSLRK